jgi:hypothetical protein
MYKKFKGSTKLVGKRLRISCLPNPKSVTKVQQMLNFKLRDYIGDYKFMIDTLQVPTLKDSQTKYWITAKLDEFNPLSANEEQIQRTMV